MNVDRVLMLNQNEKIKHVKQYVIFGATGWFGLNTINYLMHLRKCSHDIEIIAVSRKKQILSVENGSIETVDYQDLENLSIKGPIVFNYAYLTKDKVDENSTEDYIFKNINLSVYISSYLNKWQPKGVCYISSGAVYKSLPLGKQTLDEYPYGTLKFYDESFFLNHAKTNDYKIIIPRVFAVSGAYMNKRNSYALGNMVDQALRNKDIEIKAKSYVYRSYLAIETIIETCLFWLWDDTEEKNLVFDACGSKRFEIEELAKVILQVLDKKQLRIIRDLNKKETPDLYDGNYKVIDKLIRLYNVKSQSIEDQIQKSRY